MSSGFRKLLAAGAIFVGITAVGAVPITLAGGAPPRPTLTYPRCPPSDRRSLVSTSPGAGQTLVPGAPSQVLLCRYSGVGPKRATALRLVTHRVVGDPQMVSRLRDQFDALRRFRKGVYACPLDRGANILAIFRYPSSLMSDDPVTLDPGGCAPVTNGRITRTAMFPPGPALLAELRRLVG